MSDFDAFAALLDYPVYVVTAAGREPAGCLVGFAGQCSIRPSRFVVWISRANHTHEAALRADALAVHLLPRDHRLAEVFGGLSGMVSYLYQHHPDVAAGFLGSILQRIKAERRSNR
ncbi:flavin reductase, partial [Kitasatospora sp. NPDC048538]|uniref:flavin reductase family protein n=1 Tax=Kitasatospora sp. NPDC048538 TaxID=3155633 RepID=UPI00340919BF